jgi:hypothetical protein
MPYGKFIYAEYRYAALANNAIEHPLKKTAINMKQPVSVFIVINPAI